MVDHDCHSQHPPRGCNPFIEISLHARALVVILVSFKSTFCTSVFAAPRCENHASTCSCGGHTGFVWISGSTHWRVILQNGFVITAKAVSIWGSNPKLPWDYGHQDFGKPFLWFSSMLVNCKNGVRVFMVRVDSFRHVFAVGSRDPHCVTSLSDGVSCASTPCEETVRPQGRHIGVTRNQLAYCGTMLALDSTSSDNAAVASLKT